MDAASMRLRAGLGDFVRKIDWGGVATWALGFGLVVYVSFKGGGFDPLVHDQVGIAVWWIVLAGVAVGALPRRRPSPLAWGALGLLAAFVAWTALSLGWTESMEKTSADLARVAGYLGVFALALFTWDEKSPRRMVAAVGSGIALVSLVALLSRLHPAWFPSAGETAAFLSNSRERLAYPLNYWNGLATLIAIGLPLVLYLATSARSTLARAAAAAALPAMVLAIFFTFSRGGIATAILVPAVFLVFTMDRLPKLLTLLVAGGGGAVLISAALQRDALQDGLLNATARQQGDEMLVIALIVCLVVGLVQAGISLALQRRTRPRWTLVSRRQSFVALGMGVLAALIVAAAIDAPGRSSAAWSEFKDGGSPGKGAQRLSSFAGQNRFQYWESAVRENSTRPLTGTGSGTFEYWWTRDGTNSDIVRDTHSLYMQTLGELGLAGLVVLVAFLLTILIAGARRALLADPWERPWLAAALAGCFAFCLTAGFDWVWQIPVLSIALLLLASLLLAGGGRQSQEGAAFNPLPRIALVCVAGIAIVAIAIPLASSALVRQSEAYARKGDYTTAMRAARTAQNVQPGAASPRLQQALLLEIQGDYAAAAVAARAATEREKTNWRNWLVLSRVEAERGNAEAAVRDYQEVRALNPHSSLFD